MEIRNFELQYDAMYHISWLDGNVKHKWYINLSISRLLRMLEIEGYTMNDILDAEYKAKPLKFEKVVLSCNYDKDNNVFEAWGFFEESYGNTLKNQFTVELFRGDSLKNHERETIVGDVELVDEKYEEDWKLYHNK